jgi:hypothetical protein
MNPESSTKKIRFWLFWSSAIGATFVFLLFMASMLMVPGIPPSTKMWMLAIAGGGVAVSLGLGMWRFGSTEAPATLWPLGAIAVTALLLELVYCATNVFLLATRAHL